MMQLPDDMEQAFWEEIQQYEEDKHMPYVTSVEKIVSYQLCGLDRYPEMGVHPGRS
ncbi:MAG: hypothetical protein V2B19_03730 [Pseudomonadota bacterium]